jgi:hypothetical protein
MHRLAFMIVTKIATSAHASPELAIGSQQLELLPRADIFDDVETNPYVRTAGFAQLTTGNEAGTDLGVGGAVAIGGLGCDFVNATAQARLRPLSDQSAVGSADWSLCLSKVLMTVVFEGRHALGVAPAIDARHRWWRRRYDENYGRVTGAGGEFWVNDERHRHTILSISIGHGETKQEDAKIVQMDLDILLYRYHFAGNYDLELDALAITSNAIKAGTSNLGGLAAHFYPLRVRYDDGTLFASASAGWALAGGSITLSSETKVDGETVDSWTDTIDGEGLPEFSTRAYEATMGARFSGIEMSMTAAKQLYPTFGGDLALERRLATRTSYTIGKMTYALSPFIARTRMWTRESGNFADTSYGVTFATGRQLNRMLRLDAMGEAGKSPYTRLDGDHVQRSQLGGQVMFALSAGMSR